MITVKGSLNHFKKCTWFFSLIRRPILLIGLLNSAWIDFRYSGSYGGQFLLFGFASPNKNSFLAEFRREAAFFGKEDLPTIEQPPSQGSKLIVL